MEGEEQGQRRSSVWAMMVLHVRRGSDGGREDVDSRGRRQAWGDGGDSDRIRRR